MRGLHEAFSGLLDRVLNLGISDGMDAEKRHAAGSATVLHLLGFVFGLFVLFEWKSTGEFLLLPVVWITLACSAGGLYVFSRFGFRSWPAVILTLWLNGLFLLAAAAGTPSGVGFIWLFVFPSFAVLTFGPRWGAMLLSGQALCLAVLFFLPGNPLLWADYNDLARRRVFMAYLFTCCAAFAGGVIRWQSQRKIRDLMKKLERMSVTDELTGLYNRRAFNLFLEEELARFSRTGRRFCLVLCDLDHFKRVNDTYGHACGDAALRLFADILRQHTRRQDTVARWGGEEFILLLPDTDLEGGTRMADNLRERLACSTVRSGAHAFSLTVSAGVHAAREGESAEDCLRCADARLYQAKRDGRNTVRA